MFVQMPAWKVSIFGVILVRIFTHSDWIRREVLHISPYSVRMRENTDQDNSEYGHFSRSEMLTGKSKTPMHSVIWFKIDVKLILITDISISTIWGSYATTFLSWGLILHHKKFVITYSKTANLCCSLVDELIQWHLQKL